MAEDVSLNLTTLMTTTPTSTRRTSLAIDKKFVDDLEPIMKMKCDVSIVSTYQQLFVLVSIIKKNVFHLSLTLRANKLERSSFGSHSAHRIHNTPCSS
jgi:hypothetical protein